MMMVIIIIINIAIITMIFPCQIIIYRLKQVTREKGPSSILLLSQFRGNNEILVNNVKFFRQKNSLSFS